MDIESSSNGGVRRGVLILFWIVGVVSILVMLGDVLGVRNDFYQGDREQEWAVLFIGSSTIDRFPLEDLFPAKKCLNLGVGNENTLQLRDRLARTLVSDWLPAGIVLYAGSADLRFEPTLPATEIRQRVEAVVDDLREKFEQVPIVLLEVLPARSQSVGELTALRAVNRELADLAIQRSLVFVRTNRPPLNDENGDLLESMSTDRHHLNLEGYRVLTRWIVEDGGAVGALLR